MNPSLSIGNSIVCILWIGNKLTHATTMKFLTTTLAFLSLVSSGVSANSAAVDITPTKPIAASSRLGQSLLAEARRLEDGEEDFTWIADYSIVFQGCYSIKQWNGDADDDGDVLVKTTNLVRFRLCPSGTCSLWCTGGYGKYNENNLSKQSSPPLSLEIIRK